MRITSKGQVTIPKAVRDKLGVKAGDDIGFREEGQAVIVEKRRRGKKPNAGEMLFQQLLGKGAALRGERPPITSEDLMKQTRGPFDDLDSH
jgi:AbrB family looped-hinge helix DNA binding protein